MASGGVRFLSAYCTAATCTPSRYSLLTGEYAFRNKSAKILPGTAPLIIDPSRPTIASFLRDNGYATGLVGKWHLGLGPTDRKPDWNGVITPGPREVGFEYSFYMAATADRVPSVYIQNGRVVNLDPADPLQVSYEGMVGDEPTGISHPHLLKMQADAQHSGTRMPFIVSWPGKVKPGISDALVSQVDLFASFAALIGEPMPARAGADGENILSALLGKTERGCEYVVQEALIQIAVRKGNWKFIPPGSISERGGIGIWNETRVDEPVLLFHLSEDPGETRNLAGQYPDKIEEMMQIILEVAPEKAAGQKGVDKKQLGF